MRDDIPGHAGRITPVRTRAADGTALWGVLLRPPPDDRQPAFVVGHGVTNHVRKPQVARVLQRLSRFGPVIALDFRGHGRSGGRSTVGCREVLDIDAAVSLARDRGHRRVVTIGFSMGASVVVRHAALRGGVDAVAAISGPARWWVRDTRPMRRVHWLLEDPVGRAVAPVVGVRLGRPWGDRPPASPIEVVDRIAPTPLLIVHGAADHYFPAEDAVALHRAAGAGAGAELWLEAGMRHAESGMTPALTDRLGRWLTRAAGSIAPAAPGGTAAADTEATGMA